MMFLPLEAMASVAAAAKPIDLPSRHYFYASETDSVHSSTMSVASHFSDTGSDVDTLPDPNFRNMSFNTSDRTIPVAYVEGAVACSTVFPDIKLSKYNLSSPQKCPLNDFPKLISSKKINTHQQVEN